MFSLLDLKSELEKLLQQATSLANAPSQLGQNIGRQIAPIVQQAINYSPPVQQYNAIKNVALPIAQGFFGEYQNPNAGHISVASPTPYQANNNLQRAGQMGFQGLNDIVAYGGPAGEYNKVFDWGLRSASPYVRTAVAPALDKMAGISESGKQLLADIFSRAPKIEKIEAPVGNKTEQAVANQSKAKLEGLLNETVAQTKFRRGAGVTPGEMYRAMPEPPAPPAGEFTPVTKKVNALDYMRSPENVLKKMGLNDQAVFLRQQFESFQKQLPEELSKIQSWMTQAPNKDSSQKIFKYLDGKIQAEGLQTNELKVANEVKAYLKQWAVKLKLPQENQISNYITHIFERGQIEAEFPDLLAKQIDEKVASSVYDPFLQHRKINDIPYKEDTWLALQAYVKRATRKYNMDPALESLKRASDVAEKSQSDYIKSLTDKINMRPSDLDTSIDNLLKITPGIGYRFGQRPTMVISQAIRQQIYRGGLGLNVGSALRNLSQFSNTYAKLGERWTITGYLKLAKNYNSPELENVLRNSFIEDKTLSVSKRLLSKVGDGLMVLFEQAEKINRGAAYFGAKAKALHEGKTEAEAIRYAQELVRKTQFQFSSIDTPVAMQSDIMKTLTQFQSYNVKQIEFLAEMVKNKEYLGIIRYIGATLALMKVYKDAFGMKLDLVPQWSEAPSVKLVGSALSYATGNDQQRAQAKKDFISTGTMLIPAGSQIRKTYQGLSNYAKGESTASGGGMRFPIEQSIPNLIKSGLLGASAVPESGKYFDSGASVLGKNQSEAVRQSQDKQAEYQKILDKREESAQVDQLKQLVQTTGRGASYGNYYVFIDPKTGDTKTLDTSFKPTPVKPTGNPTLDKQLYAKYNGEVTKAKNIITDLYEQGQLTAQEAEKKLADLANIKIVSGTSTKKTTTAKASTAKASTGSAKKVPAFKIATSKKIGTIKLASAKIPKMIKIKAMKPKKNTITYKKVNTAIRPISLKGMVHA